MPQDGRVWVATYPPNITLHALGEAYEGGGPLCLTFVTPTTKHVCTEVGITIGKFCRSALDR